MSVISDMAVRAQAAAAQLRTASREQRALALSLMSDKLLACREQVIAANMEDLQSAGELTPAFQKRLRVDDKVFDYMVKRLKEAAALPDPVGEILE